MEIVKTKKKAGLSLVTGRLPTGMEGKREMSTMEAARKIAFKGS